MITICCNNSNYLVKKNRDIILPHFNKSDLEILPFDKGGKQIPNLLGEANMYYNYYMYIPCGYSIDGPEYPLLIYLHGGGKCGDLHYILNGGIPFLIKTNTWKSPYAMLVVSPQNTDGWWDVKKIHTFIKYLISKYKVNKARIYMTGASMGGFGVFAYCCEFGNAAYVAAVVPICGGGEFYRSYAFKNIHIWAFHGKKDASVPVFLSEIMINTINIFKTNDRAKLTIFPDFGHGIEECVYNSTCIGLESPSYDTFNISIYQYINGCLDIKNKLIKIGNAKKAYQFGFRITTISFCNW